MAMTQADKDAIIEDVWLNYEKKLFEAFVLRCIRQYVESGIPKDSLDKLKTQLSAQSWKPGVE